MAIHTVRAELESLLQWSVHWSSLVSSDCCAARIQTSVASISDRVHAWMCLILRLSNETADPKGSAVVSSSVLLVAYQPPFRNSITGSVIDMIRRSSMTPCRLTYSRSYRTFCRTSSMHASYG